MPKKELRYLIIHCTATPERRVVTPDHIRQWHIGPKPLANGAYLYKGIKFQSRQTLPLEKIGGVPIAKLTGRGWRIEGYSDMVMLDGELVNLVPYDNDQFVDPWEITNGVAGINGEARHVVYVGGLNANLKPKDTRTPQQSATLRSYIHLTLSFHPDILIAGHNQFDKNKACPSFHVPAWLKSIGIPDKNIYDKWQK